jgi:O-antigen/teichoic acid export membrane protein
MKIDREGRALRSTAAFTAFGYLGMAASFVSVPLLLQWLGRENYGLMLTALAFMSYLGFADAGLSWGLIVLISGVHGRGDRSGVASIFRHSVVLGTASALIAAGGALAVYLLACHGWRLPMFGSDSRADGLVLVVAMQCAVGLLLNPIYGVFQGLQEGYWVAFYQGCARLLGAAGTIAAAYVYRSPAIALSANVAALAVCGIVAGIHLRAKYPWLMERGGIRDAGQYSLQLRTGAKAFGLQIARTIQGTLPVLIISSVAGASAVPLYSVPATLIGAVFGVFASWNMSVQAAYGASWAANDRPWIVATFRRTLNSILLVGAVVGAGFVTAAPRVIELWTRGALHPSRAMCASVAVVVAVQTVSATVQFCLVGINQHKRIAVVEVMHTAVAVGCAVVAVHAMGPKGIGVGIAAAYAATASWLGFQDLAMRLGSNRVIPRLAWGMGLALAVVAGVGVGIGVIRLMPPVGPVLGALEAVLGAVLSGAAVLAVAVAFGVQSAADCRLWAARLMHAPWKLLRGLPFAEAAPAN